MNADEQRQQRLDEQQGRVDYTRADRGLYTFRVYHKPEDHSRLDTRRKRPISAFDCLQANKSLSKEEIRDNLSQIRGLPVIYEHRRGTGIIGKVVRVAQGPDGTLDTQCRLYSDTPDGRAAIWRVETNRDGRGASLSHYFADGHVRAQELTICSKGMRPNTGFIEYVTEPSDIGMNGTRGIYQDSVTLSRFVRTTQCLPRLGPIRPWDPSQQHVMASGKHKPVIIVPFGDVQKAHMTRRRIKFINWVDQGNVFLVSFL